METLYRKTFMSWEEGGEVWNPETKKYEKDHTRAIALVEGTWFEVAINALRDGDMGSKDENGVYPRKWYSDDLYNQDVSDVRPATLAEVELYLQYCPLEAQFDPQYEEAVCIIYSPERTDVLYKRKHQ